MTDETLSALLDGECTPAELDRLLNRMERDPDLKTRFSRLTLAREAIKGSRVKHLHADFADRVMAALPSAPEATVVPFRARRSFAWQPLAGLAVAAGVAAVAILGLRPDAQDAAPQAQLFAADATPAQTPDPHWTELDAENARRLNNYLQTHSSSQAQQGVGGTLSHARYATWQAQPTDEPAEAKR